jgi:hypothetical protein
MSGDWGTTVPWDYSVTVPRTQNQLFANQFCLVEEIVYLVYLYENDSTSDPDSGK